MHERYAHLMVYAENDSCVDVDVSVRSTFQFGEWDALKRGLGGLLAYELCKGREGDESVCAELVSPAFKPLHASASGTVPAGQHRVFVMTVDTQSLFGNNRKMKEASITSFDVTWPDDELCRPASPHKPSC